MVAVRSLSSSPWLSEIGVVTPPRGESVDLEWLPDGRPKLFFRLLDGEREGDVWVGGPRTRAVMKTKGGLTRSITIRLAPGWAMPLLGVAANELTDELVPLEALWGGAGRELSAKLITARGRERIGAVIDRAFAPRAAADADAGALARRAVHLFEAGEVRVEVVAERLGVTDRHLRRTFSEHVGIGPKAYAGTLRLQRALRIARTSRDWAAVAAEAGYYDQAHLITDFRKRIGLTPRAYFSRRAGPTESALAS